MVIQNPASIHLQFEFETSLINLNANAYSLTDADAYMIFPYSPLH